MRKGNQVKIRGEYSHCDHFGSINYKWPTMYRYTTESEVVAWHDSPASMGINSAGESMLPPTCTVVEYDGGSTSRPAFLSKEDKESRSSNDTFTIVRVRCAPTLGYRKHPGYILLRNNRTGEEGYTKRTCVKLVQPE